LSIHVNQLWVALLLVHTSTNSPTPALLSQFVPNRCSHLTLLPASRHLGLVFNEANLVAIFIRVQVWVAYDLMLQKAAAELAQGFSKFLVVLDLTLV
jgi:hypothetical protein